MILVVEDDPTTRLLICGILKKLGYESRSTENGLQAWQLLEKEYLPVVLSDWVMPEMNGMDLCRRIRARAADRYTYIIMVTSFSGRENYLEAMEAGADDFISKPVDPEHLNARLKVAERIVSLQQHVKHLEGLLSVCAYCKKIREKPDEWTSLERYVSERTAASFSHGICPSCYEKQLKQLG